MNEEENELILAQDKAQDTAQDEIVNEKISNMNEEEKKITGEIDISKTIESNIDYWRNKCFEQQKEIEKLKDKLKEERNFNKSALETLKECIHKDTIRKKLDLIDKEYAEFIEKNKNDLYLVNINAQRHSAMQLILEELLGE